MWLLGFHGRVCCRLFSGIARDRGKLGELVAAGPLLSESGNNESKITATHTPTGNLSLMMIESFTGSVDCQAPTQPGQFSSVPLLASQHTVSVKDCRDVHKTKVFLGRPGRPSVFSVVRHALPRTPRKNTRKPRNTVSFSVHILRLSSVSVFHRALPQAQRHCNIELKLTAFPRRYPTKAKQR